MEPPYIYLIFATIIVVGYFILRGKQNSEAKEFLSILNEKIKKESEFKCPACGSKKLYSGTRGWHWKTGLRGSGQIIITCLNCGDRWQPVFDELDIQKD